MPLLLSLILLIVLLGLFILGLLRVIWEISTVSIHEPPDVPSTGLGLARFYRPAKTDRALDNSADCLDSAPGAHENDVLGYYSDTGETNVQRGHIP